MLARPAIRLRMDFATIRVTIRRKLESGRLPLEKAARVLGRSATGEASGVPSLSKSQADLKAQFATRVSAFARSGCLPWAAASSSRAFRSASSSWLIDAYPI